jgi:hypothetical protein
MDFGKTLLQLVAVFFIFVFLSYVGAITPVFTSFSSSILSVPGNFVIYVLSVLIVSVLGYLLGRGTRSIKNHFEALLLSYVTALIIGGILVLLTLANFPYAVHLKLTWLGTAWYDPWLLAFFIGAPLALTFIV